MKYAHRSLLTAIKGYAELIKSKVDISAKEAHLHSDTIISGSNHLMQIVNDIMDLSKIEAGKIATESIETHLPSVIKEIKDYFSMLANKKGITFTAINDCDIPEHIISDPTRLKQILINLCGNSVKFTETGGVTLKVSCDRTNEKIILAIEDSGIGMTEEQCGMLFSAFVQADASTTRNYGGTGLGLYVSKQLAENLGGDITVTSEVGRGSVFTVTVNSGPLDNARWQSTLPTESIELKEETPDVQVPPLKGHVLYAEDNQDNQILVRRMFEPTEVILTIVDNGHEAIHAIESHSFDLVLMDLRMPVLGGVGAARELLSKGIRLPLIAVTANIEEAGIDEYIELGFEAFVEKPFDREQFYRIIAPYLAGKSKSTGPSLGKVLVAEDTTINQALIKQFLEDIDVEVCMVENGQEALDYIADNEVDLILMDINMPVMDGVEATQQLRAQGLTLPIFALTAEHDPALLQGYIDAGCNGYLSKPLDVPELHRVIRENVGG